MADSSTSQLALGAFWALIVGGLTVWVWGTMAVALWRDRQTRLQLLTAVMLIPLVVTGANALHLEHGVSWNDVARPFRDASRHSSTVDSGLAYVAAIGFTSFLGTLLLVFLLLPAMAIQYAVRESWKLLSHRRSERIFTPERLKMWAAHYGTLAFLVALIGFDSLPVSIGGSQLLGLAVYGMLLAGPPVALWQLAKYADHPMDVDPAEARRLVAAYGALLQQNAFSSRSSSELPVSKRRLKEAFRVLVPIAAAEGDLEYLEAMGTAYGLLACFGEGGRDDLTEALQLQHEWKGMVGHDSSIAAAADQARTAVKDLPLGAGSAIRERLMRDIASAELAARRDAARRDAARREIEGRL